MVGWNDSSAIYIAFSESCEPKRFVQKKKNSRTTTKSVPLLQPEHGFCQQNGPERDQVLASEWKNGCGFRLFEW